MENLKKDFAGCCSKFGEEIKAMAIEELKDQGEIEITEDLIFGHIVGDMLNRRNL